MSASPLMLLAVKQAIEGLRVDDASIPAPTDAHVEELCKSASRAQQMMDIYEESTPFSSMDLMIGFLMNVWVKETSLDTGFAKQCLSRATMFSYILDEIGRPSTNAEAVARVAITSQIDQEDGT